LIVYVIAIFHPPISSPTTLFQMYNDPNCKAWTSRTWAPEGYASRYDLVQRTKDVEESKSFAHVDENRVEQAGNGVDHKNT
jgi:hypothetical protein